MTKSKSKQTEEKPVGKVLSINDFERAIKWARKQKQSPDYLPAIPPFLEPHFSEETFPPAKKLTEKTKKELVDIVRKNNELNKPDESWKIAFNKEFYTPTLDRQAFLAVRSEVKHFIRTQITKARSEERENAYFTVIDVLTNGNYINGVDAVDIAEKVKINLQKKK